MPSPMTTDSIQKTPPTPQRGPVANPNFDSPPKAISVFVGRPDFPKCALGEHVDIGGTLGVIVDILNNSIKVRSREGATQSFNYNRLRTIYGPRPEPTELKEPEIISHQAEEAEAPAPRPRRDVIETPNFEAPVRPIGELILSPDFPKLAFGAHVDIGGYVGVVVEIVNQSLRVQSSSGTSRNYNAIGLRKIYGQS